MRSAGLVGVGVAVGVVVAGSFGTASADKVMPPDPPLAIGVRKVEIVVPTPNDSQTVQARRPDGSGIVIWTGKPRGATSLHATEQPFLGHPDLLEITISVTWRQGWAGGSHDDHIVLDIAGAADRVVCRFLGDEEHGGEWSSTRTTAKVVKRSDQPMAFDVERDVAYTSIQGPGGKKTEQHSTAVEHYAVVDGDAGCGAAIVQP